MARIVAIVPALDEAPRIGGVVRTLPGEVERILVVDDGSSDGTAFAARATGDARVEVVVHPRRRGVGAAIATGYRRARALGVDVAVVIAGDGQMDPGDLAAVVRPVLAGEADYVKGNRLAWPGGALAFPVGRLLGTVALSAALRIATGLDVDDAQCGYTAIGRRALGRLDWDAMWTGYGYPDDLLATLARARLRIAEVPVRPVYGSEVSRLRSYHVPRIGYLIGRALWRRLGRSTAGLLDARATAFPSPPGRRVVVERRVGDAEA